jgi:hypothetical protein
LVAYHAGYFTNDGELSAQHVLIQLFMGISNERAILLSIAAKMREYADVLQGAVCAQASGLPALSMSSGVRSGAG